MKLGLVCSHGGHLTELLELRSVWDANDVFFITYHSQRELPARAYTCPNLSNHPFSTIPFFFRSLAILRRERPAWVISDGAEIAIPVFIAAWLLGIRRMFIESVCRVSSTSLTGRIVYPLSNVFLVQWPGLASRYGAKARYTGGVL